MAREPEMKRLEVASQAFCMCRRVSDHTSGVEECQRVPVGISMGSPVSSSVPGVVSRDAEPKVRALVT